MVIRHRCVQLQEKKQFFLDAFIRAKVSVLVYQHCGWIWKCANTHTYGHTVTGLFSHLKKNKGLSPFYKLVIYNILLILISS